eukprot:g1131.t1
MATAKPTLSRRHMQSAAGSRSSSWLGRNKARPTLSQLGVEDKIFYEGNGYVHIRNAFSSAEMDVISGWVNDVSSWEASPDKWIHHYETTSGGEERLARTENIVSYHPGIAQLLMLGAVPTYVADCMGRDVFLYKEKINYKYPGGAGYAAHQDAPAYKQLSNHCTCLISVDDSTTENGCLEFAPKRHKEGLIGLTDDGIIDPSKEAVLDFVPVETRRGDMVIFSSYTPHRSTANRTSTPRKLIYLTYNVQDEGYLRDEYYRHKRATMKTGQVSLIKHFQGVGSSKQQQQQQQQQQLELEDDEVGSQQPSASTAKAADEVGTVGTKAEALATLKELFAEAGDTLYDPVVTQAQHALQSAKLAEAYGAPDDLVAAAFLHDVGHLILDEHSGNDQFLTEDLDHESVGASYLASAFPESVLGPIRLHVPAKRYLCSVDQAYWDGLSTASKRSLEVQGGPFSEADAAAFIAQPFAEEAVQLRRWDDLAKAAGVETEPTDFYLDGVVARILDRDDGDGNDGDGDNERIAASA